MNAYIISYFGTGKLALIRQALHYQQLCTLLQTPHVQDIHILSMDYQAHAQTKGNIRPAQTLYMDHPRIHYVDHALVSPGVARNVLMKMFNKTDANWGLFLDNDAYVDPRFQGLEFIPVVDHFSDYLAEHVDVLSTTSPRHTPFNKLLAEQQAQLASHIWLDRQSYLKTTVFVLRNRVKYGEEPIYFDEELTHMEDFEYQARLLAKGKGLYKLMGVIMADLGCNEEYSTLFAGTNRTENWLEVKQQLYQRYKNAGAVWQNNSVNWSKMQNQNAPRAIWLPKNLDYNNIINGKTFEQNNFNNLFAFEETQNDIQS